MANNMLSMKFLEAIDLIRPVTATMENVAGMWKRKNHHYVKNIVVGLMKLGYQVRFCKLNACDYGDPQARPRLIFFAAQRCAYLPSLPSKTHGPGTMMDFVTVEDALEGVSPANPPENDNQHSSDVDRLVGSVPAKTIRASKPAPLHYKHNRPITIEEMKSLFSLPSDYVLVGAPQDQRRQLGNSVPAELAAAIGRSVVEVLKYRYEGEISGPVDMP